jgi:hypothetical protein
MQTNEISLNIPTADKAAIAAAIQTLQEKLLPHLATLTKEDRITLPKMGDKTYAFVVKGVQYVTENPTLVPSFIDVSELKVDLEAVSLLRTYYNPLFQLAQALDDSMMLAGSEAYSSVLTFYQATKGAAKMGIPNAKNVYDELKARFPYKTKSKEESKL